MAFIWALLALAGVGLLMYWPHFIKDNKKREFSGTVIAVPLACIVIVAVLIFSRC